ncbi:NUDIX domain-containing protein [Catellatospora methionotrophica]|uniref:NUDIX domain-containing protein n=1 Tax=Catellatospora methionotrophica TaxID=121620 RepID=UPI0033F69083
MSDQEGQLAVVDVMLVLRDRAGRVLFARRAAHLYAGGQYNLVSGKAEPGEDVYTAMAREAHEEVGVLLPVSDLRPLGVVHTAGSHRPRTGFVFLAEHDPDRHGAVVNAEPDKCDDLIWAHPDLPRSRWRTTTAQRCDCFGIRSCRLSYTAGRRPRTRCG